MKVLQEGEIPTVDNQGNYNEYIPIEMGFKEYWPVGMLRLNIDKYTLGHKEPQEGKQMNEIIDKVAAVTDGVGVKHFALALDKDGKEIRVEIKPTGEFSQDIEDKEDGDKPVDPVTIH